ncbi:MAG: hypothetical protein OEZ01_06225, partial [Candidatus Heimdallarchaeota archaeon]|nr:hypothetical protein [Candidatus Heimdallarchaeota archaeon]
MYKLSFNSNGGLEMVSLLQNHMKTRNIKRKARIHILVLLITLLLLFNFPSQSAPQVIEENYYFIDQQFGGNNDLSLWTGSFIKKSSYATVNSTYATYDFNLDAWSTDNPLFLNTKGGFITFLTENGHEIYSTVSTGDQIIDVSAKFAGYRIPFYSTMSSNVAKPNSITIRLEYNNNYESIKLYTKLLYSLTGDREFGMDLALTDRNHQNTILGDKPINVMGSTLYASSFNKNARSIKIYDQSQYGDHDLTGDEALNMAGQLVKIPVKNNLYLRHDAAFSSINPFDGNTSIQYRIHFLTSANPYISDESAITEWNSLYHFYPLYISPEIDISHLVGFYGRFTVEVDITINTFSIESQPISDIYFILLNTFISSRVHDSPRTINENVKFAHDYARLGSEIIYDQNEFHVSATDDYIGTYMVDNSQLYISTKFDDGNFYADYTPANLPLLDNSFEYSDSLERPFVNSDIQYTTMDSMLLYTGLNQMDNGVYSSFWEKETYAFALDIKPEPTVSKTEMGIALGSGANYYFIKLHINPNVTKSEYRPYVSVHSYSTDGVGSINLLYEFDIDVDYFEFDPSLPSTLIVLNQGLQLDLYITQESAFYLGSFNGDSRILNLNSVGFVGKFGSLQAFELSGVENDELNKMYIAAKNPSDVDITLTVKTSTVGGSNGIIGELVIPANTPYNTYPLFIDETVKFSFIDRIDFYKNNPNKELILNYFILHGISQPGFMNRDASNYYRLGDYSYVLDKSVYQDNRFATYPDIIYDEAFIDNGFETAIALDQFMTSGNGSIQQIISKNEMQVFRGIGSIFATTQYSNIYEHQYTFSLPVNFNIVGLNPSEALLTYSYVAQNLAYGDSIEVLLSHPTYGDIPAFGADISRRTYVNFQSTRFNTRIVDYYLEDEVQPLITPTPMVTGSWNTIDVPLDGISLEQKDNQWKVVFTIITPAKLNRNIAPELYIDDFKIRKKLTYPMVFSIDTFLRAGPNRIELTGRATAKFSNENYIYATFTLAYRQLGGTDFTLINSGRIQMIGPLNTIVTKGVTFELLNSGKYELAVFYDVTRNET